MNFVRSIYLAVILIFTQTFGLGADIGITGFLIPSILMGIGVAIDVFIATTVKFSDANLTWKNWTLPVTLTHTLFPAFGYFLFWMTSENFPLIQAALGITGFVLVALFIYEILYESMGLEPKFGISNWISRQFGFSNSSAHVLVAVLAVSWDALWSGPAKAAQAVAGNWDGTEVFLSFIIAGLVVAITAEIALLISSLLRRFRFKSKVFMTSFNITGKYIELSVIGGFGVLSLWNAFSTEAGLYISIVSSAIIMLILFVLFYRKLWRNEKKEVTEAIK